MKLRTVLILGAGASKPYGYPTGDELQKQILANLGDPKSDPSRQLHQLGHSPAKIEEFWRRLQGADADSIDEFLRNQSAFEELGKQAIAQVLMKSEFEHSQDQQKFNRASGSWYQLFKNALVGTGSLHSISTGLVSVVTFNYDRSFENYLYQTFVNAFSSEEGEILKVLRSIRIHHIHGVLDWLPWQAYKTNRPYGSTFSPDVIKSSAATIKLAHENPRQIDNVASQLIEDAERILFLGFGYAASNLIKLGIARTDIVKDKRIIGTRFRIPGAHLDDRISEFSALENLRHVPDVDIPTFLTNHETLGRRNLK